MNFRPLVPRATNDFGTRYASTRIKVIHQRTLRPAACLAATLLTILATAPTTAAPPEDTAAAPSVSRADLSPAIPIRERMRTTRISVRNDTTFTPVRAHADEPTGGVANVGVPAAIFRSTSCGFINWIGGLPGWLDQMILFNNAALTPLRSYTVPVCYDTCHRANRCVGQGGSEDCDCLEAADLPFDANFQLYDGDPCGIGVPIAGTQGTVTLTADDIPPDTIFDGASNCFDLTIDVDPKVMIPEEVWIEALFGHDDAWAQLGHARFNTGQSPLSGLDDGVDCITFCDFDEPQCTNDPDRCDWMTASADANAEVVMQVVPTGNDKDGNLDPGVVIDGNTIRLPSGGRYVFLEMRVGDWDPTDSGVAISAFQWFIDAGGYSNDLEGKLDRATVPCSTDAECVSLFGAGAECVGNDSQCTAPDNMCCSGMFIDTNRSDFAFAGLNVLCAGDPTTADSRAACSLFGGQVGHDPEPFPSNGLYLGTLVVDVSADATGTFSAPLALDQSRLIDETNEGFIPLLGLIDATVLLPAPCCFPNGTCDDTLFEADCESLGGTVVSSCEDTNNNGLGDLCETGGCCVGTTCTASNFADCSAQGGTLVPGCLLDGDGNGTDDACECAVGSAPTPETYSGPGGVPTPRRKNRFLSIRPGNQGRAQAINVEFLQLPPPFDVWNGMTFFAGRPHQVCENPGQSPAVPVGDCGPSPGTAQRWFWAAPLVCNEALAAYRDWSDLANYCVRGSSDGRPCAGDDDCPGGSCSGDGLVHLYHPGVMPSTLETTKGPIEIASTYEIRMIDGMCDSAVAANYSDPLTLEQAGWSDTVNDCTVCPCTEPNDRIDLISDCVGVLSKFANGLCALPKTRADLEPGNIDFQINITDVVECVRAFSDTPYPFTPGDPCG